MHRNKSQQLIHEKEINSVNKQLAAIKINPVEKRRKQRSLEKKQIKDPNI